MPKLNYTLDDSILEFFSNSGTSAMRAQCDNFARQRCGGQVEPVPIQGLTSYTVTAGPNENKIIQFREENAQLDMEMLALAKRVHEDFVPHCTFLRWFDSTSGSRLAAYEMDKLQGDNYIIVRASLAGQHERQLATVHSLARFFAQAWQNPVDQVDVDKIARGCYSRFEYLSTQGDLPERFHPALTEVITNLPMLFTGDYPLVLTHGDLNEMNVLVDPDTGRITGVIDWPEATIQPFGLTLYALDNALGSMGPRGWEYFDNTEHLRNEFWREFGRRTGNQPKATMEAIRIAKNAGVFIRYGIPFDSGFKGMVGVRDTRSEDQFNYLDALL